jgi:hypothetical protein
MLFTDPVLQAQASYSFLEDLNSPNLHAVHGQPSQADISEMIADPTANLSDSSSHSDSEQDEIRKVNEEFISNEHASSGLTVGVLLLVLQIISSLY